MEAPFWGRCYVNTGVVDELFVDAVPKPPSVPTPGYFKMVREGAVLPVGKWKRTFRERVSSLSGHPWALASIWNSSTRSYVPYSEAWLKGDYLFAYPLKGNPISPPQDIIDRLLQEAVGKAKTAAWDIGTFSAELDKTHDLVTKAHNRTFSRAWDIATARGPGRAVKTMTEFASAWMEYRYGWRTLMYDLEAAQNSVARASAAKNRLDRYTAHESIVDRTAFSDSGSFHTPTGYRGVSGCAAQVSSYRTRRVDIRAGAGVSQTTFPDFTINPLLTAWELVPYSFIVDWFVDVGSVVAAHTPTLGRELEYMWISTKQTNVSNVSASWEPKPSSGLVQYTGSSGQAYDEYTETIYDRYPVAEIPFSLSLNPRLDFSKYADLAAMAIQSDRRLQRRYTRG